VELRNSGIPQPRLTLSYAEFRIHGSRLNLRPILPKHGRANAELGYKMQHFLEVPNRADRAARDLHDHVHLALFRIVLPTFPYTTGRLCMGRNSSTQRLLSLPLQCTARRI
jgi:hypothetical protein